MQFLDGKEEDLKTRDGGEEVGGKEVGRGVEEAVTCSGTDGSR